MRVILPSRRRVGYVLHILDVSMGALSDNERKDLLVGSFLLASLVAILVLLAALGAWSGARGKRFVVRYGFAGGVDLGAPVRVAGIKVGKVEAIDFLPRPSAPEAAGEAPAAVQLRVSVSPEASALVRQDSRFYVNIAGIIGERYVEIVPGSAETPELADGAVVRGVDPPRIDQLLSQGYGVFGKILGFLERNERAFDELLADAEKLLRELVKTLSSAEKKRLFSLVENLGGLAGDLRLVAKGLSDPKAKQAFGRMSDLLDRLYRLDEGTLRKFLQEEGIRARVF